LVFTPGTRAERALAEVAFALRPHVFAPEFCGCDDSCTSGFEPVTLAVSVWTGAIELAG
jgi:hypothetical protein